MKMGLLLNGRALVIPKKNDGWHKDLSLHTEQCFSWVTFKPEAFVLLKLCPVVETDDTASCALLSCLVQPVLTLPDI